METTPSMEEKPEINKPPKEISKEEPKKEGKGLKIGIAVCAILALAGIGFGIYELTEANKAKNQPTDNTTNQETENELADLKQKYSVLQNYVKELEASGTEIPEEAKSATETSTSLSFHNAIITSNDNNILTQIYETDNYYNGNRSISISISNGEITECTVFTTSSDIKKDTVGDCQITGISGKISTVSQMGNTQMTWPYLGFLLEDGSVEYISANDLADSLSASIKGKLKFEFRKPVTNIVNHISVRRPGTPGGYRTTAFYHNDGSLSLFNESMLAE